MGLKKVAPPNQPLLDEYFDFKKNLYLIYTNFNLKPIFEKMKLAHPEWSEKQCYNPRYWRGTARKKHKNELEIFIGENPKYTIDKTPEAKGLNVHRIMKDLAQITLEWPPRKVTRIVSIAGKLL